MLAIMFAQIGGAIASPFVGQALDRFPTRVVMSGGVAAFACGAVLLTFATALWQISIIYLIFMALGMTMAGPMGSQALAARWFQANRGLAIGIATTGTAVGGVTMPLLSAWLLESHGWETTHLIAAALAIIVVVPLALLIIKSTPDEAGVDIEQANVTSTAVPDQTETEEWTLARIFRERNLWITIIAFISPMIVISGFMANMASYGADAGISARRAATLISALSLAMFFSKLIFGSLADRFDHRMLYGVGMAMIVSSLGLLTGIHGYAVLVAIIILMGAGIGSMLPLVGAIVSTSFATSAFGRVLGLVYMAFSFAAVGAPLAGAIRDQTGSYNGFLYFSIVIIAISTVSIFWLRVQPKQVD